MSLDVLSARWPGLPLEAGTHDVGEATTARATAPDPTSGPWSRRRSTPWPRAASTTTSAAGFARYSVDQRVAGPPLREDALRPGPARPGVPPRLAGHRPRPLPPGGRRDRRLRAARPAPPRRRLPLGRGRRQRGRGGPVLRVDARRRSSRRSTATTTWPTRSWRSTACRRAGTSRAARSSTGWPTAATLERPAAHRGRPPPPVRRPRAAGAAGPRRQGADRVERPDARRRSPRRPPPPAATTGWRRPWPTASSCCASCVGRTGAGCARGRSTARPAPLRARHLAYAADHGALVDAFVALAEATGEARWIDAARTTADTLLDLFWDAERGGVFTTGQRRRTARDPQQGPHGQRHTGRQQPGGSGAAAPRRAHRRGPLPPPGRPDPAAGGPARGPAPHRLRSPARGGRPGRARRRRGGGDGRPSRPRREVAQPVPAGAVLAWGERYDSPLWAGREDGAAYVCRDYACQLPATDPDTLRAQLATTANR